MMTLYLKRMTGEILFTYPARYPDGMTREKQRDILRNALQSCYDSNGTQFWPKDGYGLRGTRAVPEEAVLVNNATTNEELRYNLAALIKDARLMLVGQKPGTKAA